MGDTGEVSPGHHGCMSKKYIEVTLRTWASGMTLVFVSVMTPAGLVKSRGLNNELAVMALAGTLVSDRIAGHVIFDPTPDGSRTDRWLVKLHDGDCRLRNLEKVAERVLESVSGRKDGE